MNKPKWSVEKHAWAGGAEIEQLHTVRHFSQVGRTEWRAFDLGWSEWRDFDGVWTESVARQYRVKPPPSVKTDAELLADAIDTIAELRLRLEDQRSMTKFMLEERDALKLDAERYRWLIEDNLKAKAFLITNVWLDDESRGSLSDALDAVRKAG